VSCVPRCGDYRQTPDLDFHVIPWRGALLGPRALYLAADMESGRDMDNSRRLRLAADGGRSTGRVPCRDSAVSSHSRAFFFSAFWPLVWLNATHLQRAHRRLRSPVPPQYLGCPSLITGRLICHQAGEIGSDKAENATESARPPGEPSVCLMQKHPARCWRLVVPRLKS
jgi:hypothetical protein